MEQPKTADLDVRRAAILRHAARPDDPDSHVFACVIALRQRDGFADMPAAVGVTADAFAALTVRYFPSLPVVDTAAPHDAVSLADSVLADEMADLRALLLDHRRDPGIATDWMAAVVARACLFRDHLWQDLGLVRRQELSGLLMRHFPALAALNTGDMKWKKFFYKQLCDRSGLNLCKAPSCGVCTDRPLCFGPEQ